MAKRERQSLEGSADGLSFGKPKRDRSWDRAHGYQVTSYRLPTELQEAIKAVAAELGVSPADVAKVFLEYGLAAYKDGRLTLTPKPKSFTLD